jgi:hypothetical protein
MDDLVDVSVHEGSWYVTYQHVATFDGVNKTREKEGFVADGR